jgi:hypothetical protein
MEKAQKILLIHLFSNGDCLYATTIARQIKNDFPGCHLLWAISSACKNILLNNPDVDEVVEVEIPRSSENESVFSDVIKEFHRKKLNGEVDEVYITQILGDNFSKYDSCVRTSIYRCYGKPLTVDKTPILILTEDEIQKANEFAITHKLSSFRNVILFECAPQSGQVNLSDTFIKELAAQLIKIESTCVIMSSAKKIEANAPNVFDGSLLTIRETAALSHYCSLLIGCSSGITWATFSTGAKKLPTLQLLNKGAYIYNPPSIALKRTGAATNLVIELFEFDLRKVLDCINTIFTENFETAKQLFDQPAKKQFKIYRGITHNFLAKGKTQLLKNFIQLNLSEHGWNFSMLFKIIQGIVLFPAQLIVNKIKGR